MGTVWPSETSESIADTGTNPAFACGGRPVQSDLLGPLAQLAEQRTSNRSAWSETARMTPLKVGEPFACTLGMAIPSQAEGDLGRCRDWTGGTYSAQPLGVTAPR